MSVLHYILRSLWTYNSKVLQAADSLTSNFKSALIAGAQNPSKPDSIIQKQSFTELMGLFNYNNKV